MSSEQHKFGYRTTAEEVASGIDLHGKVAIVTGGNNGIGKEAARVLAKQGAHVIIAGRDLGRVQAAVDEIKENTGNTNVEGMLLDLGSFASVRKFADAFLAKKLPVHVLLCNGAIMAVPYAKTVDGFESQFGTNHLAHFLLTKLLTDVLVASAPSRVVSISSTGHRRHGINWNDVNWEVGYDKWQAYGQAKTAQILFPMELNRRLSSKGVTGYSVHPGGIMTGLQKALSREEQEALGWIDASGKVHELFKNVEQGAATHVYCSIHADAERHAGGYFEDAHVSKVMTEEAGDPEAATRLWDLSEQLIASA